MAHSRRIKVVNLSLCSTRLLEKSSQRVLFKRHQNKHLTKFVEQRKTSRRVIIIQFFHFAHSRWNHNFDD